MNDTDLLQLADQCVKCGLCLPHCPTYRLGNQEAESPRGRISLVQGLVGGDLEADRSLQEHLEHCLHCLCCQRVCPSRVDYQRIIDAGMARLPRRRRLYRRLLAELPYKPGFRRLLAWLRLGAGFPLLRRLAPVRLRRWLDLLPPIDQAPLGAETADIQLFVGCIGGLADVGAQQALIRIARRLDLSIGIPAGQQCCGALHRHAGEQAEADTYAAHNQTAFTGAQTILCTSSGCGSQLKQAFGDRLEDVASFLLEQLRQRPLALRPLPQSVALHTPCSLRNVLGTEQRTRELLAHIPDIRLQPLDMVDGCCGGAGLQLLTQPVLADRLAAPLIAQVAQGQCAILLTSSAGCALHLNRAAREAGLQLEVLHPVELLARQLD